MKYYTIYQITNLLNNKIYVGKHQTNDLNDVYVGSGKIITRAIRKYGIKSFKNEILYKCRNEVEMDLIERKIVDHEFINRLDTYNLIIGGNPKINFTPLSYSKKQIKYTKEIINKIPKPYQKNSKIKIGVETPWGKFKNPSIASTELMKLIFSSNISKKSKKYFSNTLNEYHIQKLCNRTPKSKNVSIKFLKILGEIELEWGNIKLFKSIKYDSNSPILLTPWGKYKSDSSAVQGLINYISGNHEYLKMDKNQIYSMITCGLNISHPSIISQLCYHNIIKDKYIINQSNELIQLMYTLDIVSKNKYKKYFNITYKFI